MYGTGGMPHYNTQPQPATALGNYGPNGNYPANDIPAPVGAILDLHQRLEKVDIYAPPNQGSTKNNKSENTTGKPKSRKAHTSAYLTDSDTDEDDANNHTQSAGRGRRKTQYPQDNDILYGASQRQHHPNNNDDGDEEEVNAIIIKRSNGPTMHARDHNIIPAPRMGSKSVNSKLLKHYGEMTDGGRAYDKAGSTKNKMGLKHLLKITKQAVEEHQLNDEAAYALFRKALTGNCLLYTSDAADE